MSNPGNNRTEASLLFDIHGNPVPVGCPDTESVIKVATGNASAVINSEKPSLVNLTVDADSYISIGTNPTANNTKMPLWATQSIDIWVLEGEKVAVSGGNLYITPYR